ncbi:MAG TPA: cysteine desulfurase-like protein [Candidatus Sulfotelmatobacter sp.]|jgi:cysteine desulfurase family protein (TIGR01976 family)|nr:cysteine desulfurase-like protein [Candidatus Sulfotelmatobacter sp.]
MLSTETTAAALDLTWVRSQFPSLTQTVNGHPAVFFDGPGGTQVPQRVLDAISSYLRRDNANSGGNYPTSRRTDAVIAAAREAMADFFHSGADEVVFGQNMTSLTFAISSSIGRELGPGDEIVVTRLDHDANVSPWLAMAEDRGVTVRWAEIHDEDCTLDMADLASKINAKTKLVAVGYASNAVGTINPVKEVVRLAHAARALAFIDAVHYTPHGLIDVAALDCDFLVCSTYKFFGPHMGVLFGKREHLKRLRPYKVRPLTDAIPFRWEWGTLNHECIAGITACVEYITDMGRRARPEVTTRRAAIEAAYEITREHERALLERAMTGLRKIPGLKIYGITDPARFHERCATLAIRIDGGKPGHTPLELATQLGDRGFFTWDGNYYALNLTEHFNIEKSGGFLRIGLVHYNTVEEVDRLLVALRDIVGV